jgi:hypothetical protein
MTCKTYKKEIEWTIQFDFPNEPVFPTKYNTYQTKLDENVLCWTDKAIATDFATEKCGKYGWRLVATKIQVCESMEASESFEQNYMFI